MKAVVLEIKNKYAAVLTKDGRVERIPDRAYTVGQEIELPKKSIIYSGAFRTIAAAAALFIVITGLGITGYRRNLKECAYVTVDVNPSLEYAMNAKRKVLRVRALNADAEAIAERLTRDGIRGQELESALQNTKDVLYEDGFLGEEKDNAMLISVVTDDESMRSDLKAAAESVAAAEDVAVYVVDASISERKEAQEKGISTGRYEVTKDSPAEAEKAEKGSVKELVEARDVPQVAADPAVAATVAATATVAQTPTEAPVATIPPTATPTPKPGKKPTPTPAAEVTAGAEPTATPAAELTPAAATPTPAPTEEAKPTESIPEATATHTATPTPEPTATPTPKPGSGPMASPTPTPRPGPRPTDPPTPIPEPTVTPTEVPVESPTPTEVPAEEQQEEPTPEAENPEIDQ